MPRRQSGSPNFLPTKHAFTCSLTPLIERALIEGKRQHADLSQEFDRDAHAFDSRHMENWVENSNVGRTGEAGRGETWSLLENTYLKRPVAHGVGNKKKKRGKKSSAIFKEKMADQFKKRLKSTDRQERLTRKWTAEASIKRTSSYSIVDHGSSASTGWNGLAPKPARRDELTSQYLKGELNAKLARFFRVPYEKFKMRHLKRVDQTEPRIERTRPSFSGYYWSSQTIPASKWPDDISKVLFSHQFIQVPILGLWHRSNQVEVDAFLKNETFQRLVNWVSGMVECFYPGVAKRFRDSTTWHKGKYGIEPLFGLFWNFCVNMPFSGQKRVHCLPHADSKNVVGSKTWLVLWEAGVIIELPPWVAAIYPSSLLYHFNVDVSGKESGQYHVVKLIGSTELQVVVTANGERPTRENSQSACEENGRGSVVFFNQATMYQSAETGFHTIEQAKKAGHSGKVDYGEVAQKAFQKIGSLVPL
ncbi:hypothetical protein BJ165DRAFT_1571761 [Panaeolus papilionaceus]|nr:hypothetical protein BJ165DRAFT_1571761 [Panaeolus papilionaceus]